MIPMLRRLPVLLLAVLLAACTLEQAAAPQAVAVVMPDGGGGTIVTDYGGGPTPVARYIRLPDGTRVVVASAPAGAPGKTASPGAAVPAAQGTPAPNRLVGSGSAFAVTRRGLAVTNAHVVQGCNAVVDETGQSVRVVALDRRRDLALLDFRRTIAAPVRFRDRASVDLGESVLVFGYPYGQALGTGINVTNGIVTGLAGPGGDHSRFQMNAAVQPGNSGGPAVDEVGQLLGVAVGRLNDIAVLRATGSLPQGINFAVRAEQVERFLRDNGVTPERGPANAGSGPRAVSAAVAPAVFQVLCRG